MRTHTCLKNGNYAAQPNNRLIWSIPSFTVKDEIPYDWKTQTHDWNVEDTTKWRTEDSDKFFYGIEKLKMTKCKNCNCDCHCSLKEHGDMYGVNVVVICMRTET
jgi:hypothetical protein